MFGEISSDSINIRLRWTSLRLFQNGGSPVVQLTPYRLCMCTIDTSLNNLSATLQLHRAIHLSYITYIITMFGYWTHDLVFDQSSNRCTRDCGKNAVKLVNYSFDDCGLLLPLILLCSHLPADSQRPVSRHSHRTGPRSQSLTSCLAECHNPTRDKRLEMRWRAKLAAFLCMFAAHFLGPVPSSFLLLSPVWSRRRR